MQKSSRLGREESPPKKGKEQEEGEAGDGPQCRAIPGKRRLL